MAITTAAKRQSALLDEAAPVAPDGYVGGADRRTLLGQYGGNAPADFSEFVRTRTRRTVGFTAVREKP
jgi:hypothetical protein